MKLEPREVAPGVYCLGTRWINFHIVEEEGELLLVDAGYPLYWRPICAALAAWGRPVDAVRGVIVTHHHVDHAGTAEAFRLHAGCPVYVHAGDREQVRGEERSAPPPGFYRPAWRVTMARYLAHTVRWGGARYRPVRTVRLVDDGEMLDAPGRPRVLFTPGHTAGHCCVVLPERGVLLTGDALASFDYASGTTGIAMHRFNEDRRQAARSLDKVARVDGDTVLFGHGGPWHGSPADAVSTARARL